MKRLSSPGQTPGHFPLLAFVGGRIGRFAEPL